MWEEEEEERERKDLLLIARFPLPPSSAGRRGALRCTVGASGTAFVWILGRLSCLIRYGLEIRPPRADSGKRPLVQSRVTGPTLRLSSARGVPLRRPLLLFPTPPSGLISLSSFSLPPCRFLLLVSIRDATAIFPTATLEVGRSSKNYCNYPLFCSLSLSFSRSIKPALPFLITSSIYRSHHNRYYPPRSVIHDTRASQQQQPGDATRRREGSAVSEKSEHSRHLPEDRTSRTIREDRGGWETPW